MMAGTIGSIAMQQGALGPSDSIGSAAGVATVTGVSNIALLHWWKADEASGNLANSGSDSSVLVPDNTPTYQTTGVPFSTDSYSITFPTNDDGLNLAAYAGNPKDDEDFTIEVYAKWTSAISNDYIFYYGDNSPLKVVCDVRVNRGSTGTVSMLRDGPIEVNSSGTSYNDGNWHQVAVTHKYNGTDDIDLELFVDGVSEGTMTGVAQVSTQNMRIEFSRLSSVANTGVPGMALDEMRLYDEVRSASFLLDRYNEVVLGI